jgi:hypothetical protein
MHMDLTDDIARFRAGDPDLVVAASLACPWCLHKPTSVLLDADEHEPAATCFCADCSRSWTVALSVEQSLRLALAPPPGVWLRRALEGGRPRGVRWRR